MLLTTHSHFPLFFKGHPTALWLESSSRQTSTKVKLLTEESPQMLSSFRSLASEEKMDLVPHVLSTKKLNQGGDQPSKEISFGFFPCCVQWCQLSIVHHCIWGMPSQKTYTRAQRKTHCTTLYTIVLIVQR